MSELKKTPGSLGFVPTMGALHQGHISLVKASKSLCNKTIASIFINPKQFNNPEDFKKYPKTLTEDMEKLAAAGTDFLFLPFFENLFSGYESVKVNLHPIDSVFEAEFRPGHFQGVVDVLFAFFDMIQPSDVFFGLKDLQQCLVVEKLIDSHFPAIKQHNNDTCRENDGLAMSSRNKRLSEKARLLAPNIYKKLKQLTYSEDFEQAKAQTVAELENSEIKTEYLEKISLPNMEIIKNEQGATGKRALIFAGYLDGIRLIDNIIY